LRAEGKRYDIINALLAKGIESNLVLLVDRMEALAEFLQGDDGTTLMAGYRRASNILQIENAKDGPHQSQHNPSLLIEPAEYQLAAAIKRANVTVDGRMTQGDFTGALSGLAELRQPIDEFFDAVTVNTADPGLRLNRLALLFELNGHLHAVADFSKLEG
jgi:glycyl-tRNA synthetase beta chain